MSGDLFETRDLLPGDRLTDTHETVLSVEKWGADGVVYRVDVERTLDDGSVVPGFFYAGEEAEHYGVVREVEA